MCPLQCPRPSPPSDAGIRLPCSSPANLKIFKNYIFFKRLLHTFHIHFVRTALSCALPAF
ncbi:unnamed protein product [Staurois parvus]|uniref:Uncharacterized protein n=1 Tax=Staurois parvus TaxID=386267 RepID=A0ABN9GVS2_9NEOB|nr:unnamed protein product [Staurois parvus]